VLPFDVTLAGANEYGAMCAAKILGVEILNEGSGISVDDAEVGTWATFVALRRGVPGYDFEVPRRERRRLPPRLSNFHHPSSGSSLALAPHPSFARVELPFSLYGRRSYRQWEPHVPQ